MKKDFKVGDRVSFEWLNWAGYGSSITWVSTHQKAKGTVKKVYRKKGYAVILLDPREKKTLRPVMLQHLRKLVRVRK